MHHGLSNFDKICISLKMGCYLVKVSATYPLEVNLIFNLTLKYIYIYIYIKDGYNTREKFM